MLITHTTVVNWLPQPALTADSAVCIENGQIAALGATEDLVARYPDAERLDARGMWLLPGLVCAHTHLYSTFARGMAVPGDPPADFPAILRQLWWRLDRALGYEDIRYSALVALADAIRHGVTTLFDHHSSPTATRFSLDVLAEAVTQAGLRASLCYEISDRDGAGATAAGLAENERFLSSPSARGPLLRGMVGLHASFTLSDTTIRKALEVAGAHGVGCHVHVAEGEADLRETLRVHGVRVVERWSRLGVLGPRTIAAHCVHIDNLEIDRLRDTHTRVVHNPRSNMNNAVGAAGVPLLLRRGIPVGLGNDGFSQDMWRELEVGYLLPHQLAHDPRASAAPAYVDMLLRHNAETAGAAFDLPLGSIVPGAAADLVLVPYHAPTPVHAGNLPWHLFFGVDHTPVDTTIVNGRVLMRHGELVTLDEGAIAAQASKLAAEVWRRL